MKESTFITLCNAQYIEPQIALENNDLCDALRDNDDVEVQRILIEEF